MPTQFSEVVQPEEKQVVYLAVGCSDYHVEKVVAVCSSIEKAKEELAYACEEDPILASYGCIIYQANLNGTVPEDILYTPHENYTDWSAVDYGAAEEPSAPSASATEDDEIQLLQETLLVGVYNPNNPYVEFATRYGRGCGRASIPVEHFQEFIECLEKFDKASNDPNFEIVQDNGTVFSTNGFKDVQSVFRLRTDDYNHEQMKIRTFLGKGNKPLWLKKKNLPKMIQILKQAHKRIPTG